MSKTRTRRRDSQRLATGLSGLDTIWLGGPARGGAYLIMGRPGAGKTILASQICFNHVAAGGRALFVTLLTESPSRLLHHLGDFEFFDKKQVGAGIKYVSGYGVLEQEGLSGLLKLLRRMIRDERPTVLVIDGLLIAGVVAESELEIKKFIHELQISVELVGCTVLMLTSESGSDHYALRTMVDGVLELRFDPFGMSIVRTVEVVKSRGTDFLPGRHRLEIRKQGLVIYPRIETALNASAERRRPPGPRLPFGIEGLDAMLSGGLPPASVTMLLGAAGSGKTLLGLSFLAAGAHAREPGLFLGFSETPAELIQNAQGLDGLARQLKSKHVGFLWQRPGAATIPDAVAHRVLDQVKARGVRRLFIDGTAGLKDFFFDPARTVEFFSVLCNELRRLGVATILAEETRDLFGPAIELSMSALAPMPDTIIVLRHVELRAKLHRLISVMKMRGGSNDSALREFVISSRGLELSSTFDSAEAVLSGVARMQPER